MTQPTQQQIRESLKALDNITENPYRDGTESYHEHESDILKYKETIRTVLENTLEGK